MEQSKVTKYTWYLFQIIMLSLALFDSKFKIPILIFGIQSIIYLLFLLWLNIRKYNQLLIFETLTELCYTIISCIYLIVLTIFIGGKCHHGVFVSILLWLILSLPIIANIILLANNINEYRRNNHLSIEPNALLINHLNILSPIFITIEIIYIAIMLYKTGLSVAIISCLILFLLIRLFVKNQWILKVYSFCWLLFFPICILLSFSISIFYIPLLSEMQIAYIFCIIPLHVMIGAFETTHIDRISGEP